jgi:hypothetical protein
MRQSKGHDQPVDDELGDPELPERYQCLTNLQSEQRGGQRRICTPEQQGSAPQGATDFKKLTESVAAGKRIHVSKGKLNSLHIVDDPVVPRAQSLLEAIQWTLLYGSIFDYPLTRDELYRYLMAPGGRRAEVEQAIDDALARTDGMETDGQFLYPAGRSDTVTTRLKRGCIAHQSWKRARFYARLIWALPYVRMVAVTGALAMNNVEKDDDIDFLIVTEANRLWMTRGMILLLARLAHVRGDTLCPNYMVTSRALQLEQRDAYTAHELAQMATIHGRQVAVRLWAENAWCRDFLPNARLRVDEVVDARLPWILVASKVLGRAVLDLPVGNLIERWEQRRKIARLSREAPVQARETRYTADVCKGHADGHGRRVMALWEAEVARHGHSD